jgi:ankyrin repeat protein
VQNGNLEIARFLLERGAKVNIRDHEKRTPLMMLDDDATPEMLQLLLAFGAKFPLTDKAGSNALHYAASKGIDPELIRTLVNYGINVNAANKEGKTALMLAAEENESEAVAALLESGADVNMKTRDGRSALDIADGESVRTALQTYGAVTNK